MGVAYLFIAFGALFPYISLMYVNTFVLGDSSKLCLTVHRAQKSNTNTV
jgi:hypothetical protein